MKVGSALEAKAKAPAAPDTAKQKSQQSSVGKGQLTMSTAQPSSFWTEEADVDDDATVETSDFLYDAQRGVVYTYREDYRTGFEADEQAARVAELNGTADKIESV